MLEIIQFQFSGKYGIRNTLTGVILEKKNGDVRMFRTQRGAARYIRKLNKSLNNLVAKLSKEPGVV